MKLDIDVQLKRGAFELDVRTQISHGLTGVFGPSGSGKSTLLHLIAGIIGPDSGQMSLDDQPLCNPPQPAHRRRIAVVFQDSRLFPHFTVAGNLRYGWNLLPPSERRLGFDDVVSLLDLAPLLQHKPHELSGGQAQRVALGRALLCSPRLLLLDEPLASLDRGLKSRILPFLRRVRDELSVPMIHVSHDLTELLSLTDHLLIMDGGGVRGSGRFLDLVQQEGILDVMHDLGLLNVTPLELEDVQTAEGVASFKTTQGDYRWIGPIPNGPGRKFFGVLRPEDIALVHQPIKGVSIQNQAPGRIENLIISQNRALCVVDCGVRLLAEVTPHAIHNLELAPGKAVYCLFKAQALTYLDQGVSPSL